MAKIKVKVRKHILKEVLSTDAGVERLQSIFPTWGTDSVIVASDKIIEQFVGGPAGSYIMDKFVDPISEERVYFVYDGDGDGKVMIGDRLITVEGTYSTAAP